VRFKAEKPLGVEEEEDVDDDGDETEDDPAGGVVVVVGAYRVVDPIHEGDRPVDGFIVVVFPLPPTEEDGCTTSGGSKAIR
jgi:hypothetical protein